MKTSLSRTSSSIRPRRNLAIRPSVVQIASCEVERVACRSQNTARRLLPWVIRLARLGWPHDQTLTTLALPMEALAHITTAEFAIAFLVSFLAAALHSTVGFGFALLSVPILSLLNPLFAPVPQLLVVFPLTLAIVMRERHAVEVKSTLWIFAGRVPGALRRRRPPEDALGRRTRCFDVVDGGPRRGSRRQPRDVSPDGCPGVQGRCGLWDHGDGLCNRRTAHRASLSKRRGPDCAGEPRLWCSRSVCASPSAFALWPGR